MDKDAQRKWDAASRTLDFFSFAEDHRIGPHKRRLFTKMRGATLMVAAGTGNDFKFFPPNMHVVAIDISPKMLERAARKARACSGSIELREMDVCDLEFPESTFDTVANIISETCDIPRDTIKPESHAINDLGIDSLDFLDIAFAIDKAFGIKLPLEQWTQEVNDGKATTEQYFVLKNLCARIDDLVAAKGK